MEINNFLEILKYILPSIIVFLTSFYFLKHFLDHAYKKRLIEMKTNNQKVVLPLRLQAYERLALFLERISPGSLIMRTQRNGMSATQLQLLLIQTIRDEFEHNVSQQVYVSTPCWEMVKAAKEELIKLVNTAASKLNDNATGLDLSQKIIEIYASQKTSKEIEALQYLKNEIRILF